jgi:hypothetical protein
VPAQANDLTVATYITDLRDYGRVLAARFEALRIWALTGQKPTEVRMVK